LESSLSTDASQRGDRFQARVVEPREFAGAIVDGRVTLVKRAGKVKGTSELQLAFADASRPAPEPAAEQPEPVLVRKGSVIHSRIYRGGRR